MAPLLSERPTVAGSIALALALIVLIAAGGCGVPVDDYGEPTDETTEGGVPVAETEQPAGQDPDEDDAFFLDSFAYHKHATVTTDFDTYDIRNVSFNTGLGYGSSDALTGYYLNTKLDLEFKYISEVRVVGRVSMSEALSVPHRYDMVEEHNLDYIFRTELRKTDGEWIEYIVRINRIGGTLQEGGGVVIAGDELQTLKRIVFF